MGKRAQPFTGTVMDIADNIVSGTEELKDEIGQWRESLEENEMEHLPKYEEVEECFSILEAAHEAAEEIRNAVNSLPTSFQQRVLDYTQDTRKKASSRSYRLDDVRMMVIALQLHGDDVASTLEAEIRLDGAEHAIYDTMKELLDACDMWEGEADGVFFPGMFG